MTAELLAVAVAQVGCVVLAEVGAWLMRWADA